MPGFESGVLYEILDCAPNRILPVPHRLDSVVRFALPLRAPAPESLPGMHLPHPRAGPGRHDRPAGEDPPPADSVRSEEHTSELQSQSNLVCRLLLEKKKTKHTLTTLTISAQIVT